MSLRVKLLLTFFLAFVAMSIAFYSLSTHFILNRFEKLDASHAEADMRLFESVIKKRVEIMSTVLHDWAVWDDAYEFVANPTEQFLDSNEDTQTFANLEINLIVWFDPKGGIVNLRYFDATDGKFTSLSEDVRSVFVDNSSLWVFSDKGDCRWGYLPTPAGILQISARPILDSEEKKPIGGALLFARFMNQAELKKLSSEVGFEVTRTIPSAADSVRSVKDSIWLDDLTDNQLTGNLLLSDVFGRPSILLQSQMPRAIYLQGMRTVEDVSIFMGLALVFILMAMLWLVRQHMLKPIGNLIEGSLKLGRGEFDHRVEVVGDDELGDLAQVFNSMAEAVQQSHSNLESKIAERTAEIEKANKKLSEQLRTDPLTGVLSRRHGLELLEDEFYRNKRYDSGLSVLLIDVDDFKHINDEYGHAAGDEALKAVASRMSTALRITDKLVRYGGDEFLAILPNTSITGAEAVCKKLLQASIKCGCRDGEIANISLSIGGAVARGQTTFTEIIDEADLCMLIAKKKGKGQFYCSTASDDSEDDLGVIRELKVTRNLLREVLCKTLGSILIQQERDGDVLGIRPDMMMALAEAMAGRINLSRDDRTTLRNCVRLARFEILYLPTEIENADGELSQRQENLLRDTFKRNLDHLEQIPVLMEEVRVLSSIHERFDGKGYPRGIEADEIPVVSMLINMALTFSRYFDDDRDPLGVSRMRATEAINKGRGTAFPEKLAEEFLNVVDEYFTDSHDQITGRILLIEDHIPIAKILAKWLTSAGYEVELASTAAEAYRLLESSHWYAILTDIMLPDGNGLEILRHINEKKIAPCAVISSRYDTDAVAEAKKNNAFAYAVKPIRFEKLLISLARLKNTPGLVQRFQMIDH